MEKFPSFADLSDEQLDIYHFDKNTPLLITGGPGSGKTVMALWRTCSLIKSRQDVNLLMFNKVLLSYTKPYFDQLNEDNIADHRRSYVSTVNSYMSKSYRKVTGKNLGRTINYDNLLNWAIDEAKDSDLQNLFGSFFVVDEGQDFSPSFYQLLGEAWRRLKDKFCPTILADENQILNEHTNSSINDIRSGLGLIAQIVSSFGEKELTINYRNTREIATLANFFYDDTASTPPIPPNIESRILPKYLNFIDQDQAAQKIVNYSNKHPSKKIGVLLAPGTNGYLSKTMAESIRDNQGLNGELYHYSSDAQYKVAGVSRPNETSFQKQGTVTVLSRQSSKGLEFDTVFVMHIESLEMDDKLPDTKRNLYVLCTRSREHLFLCSVGLEENSLPKIMEEDFFQLAIDQQVIDMSQDLTVSNAEDGDNGLVTGISTPVKPKKSKNQRIVIKASENPNPASPKFSCVESIDNGVGDVWKLIAYLSEEPIIYVVLIGSGEANKFHNKMSNTINGFSQDFITGLKINNGFQSRNGREVRVIDSISIDPEMRATMIIPNLQDVFDFESQFQLKSIIDNCLERSYFFLCKGMSLQQSKGVELLKKTNDLKILHGKGWNEEK